MPAVQETVDQVRRIDVDQYKYGFETSIESEKAPKGLSENTVNAHVKHILEKLHVNDRTHAVTTALKRGIIRL